MFSIDETFALLNKQLYSLISKLYNLIISISEQKLVTNEMVESITERLFLIISVVMLFMLVYALLRSIINTDFLSKGDFSGSKIVLNFIKSIIIIVLVPSAFNLMYSLQSSILEQNVIGKVILGNENTDSVANLSDGFSYFLFSAFFTDNDSTEFQTIEQGLINDNWDLIADDDTISEITNGRIIFNGLAAAVAACVAIYILVVYAIDIAIRSVKLAFLHIIAPVPIIMSVIPSQDKAFKSWLKTVLSTFADIFIKLAILVFGFSIIKSIFTQDAAISSLFGENAIVKAFIILGILAFINKAPKLLSDIFGISSASNFSIKDRWKDIKEGYNTVTLGTRPINAVVSRVAGVAGSINGTRMGLDARNITEKKDRIKSYLASAGGALLWSNDGIKSYGRRTKYSLAAQRVKGRGGNILDVWKNDFRDELGLDSYEKEQIEIAETRSDSKVTNARKFLSKASFWEKDKMKKLDKFDETNKELSDERSRLTSFTDKSAELLRKPSTSYNSFRNEVFSYYDAATQQVKVTSDINKINSVLGGHYRDSSGSFVSYGEYLTDLKNKNIINGDDYDNCLVNSYLNSKITLPISLKDENGNPKTDNNGNVVMYELNCDDTNLSGIDNAKKLLNEAFTNREISFSDYNDSMKQLSNAEKSLMNRFYLDIMRDPNKCTDLETRNILLRIREEISMGTFGRDSAGNVDTSKINLQFDGSGFKDTYDYFDGISKHLKNTISSTDKLKHDEMYKTFSDENGNTTYFDPLTGKVESLNLYNIEQTKKNANRIINESVEEVKNIKAQYVDTIETNEILDKTRNKNKKQ